MLAGAYLGSVLKLSGLEEYLFKASVIIVFTYINIRGIRDVGAVSTIISILVLAAFALVAAVGFATWQTNPFVPFIPPDQSLLQSVGYGLAIGMWVYTGGSNEHPMWFRQVKVPNRDELTRLTHTIAQRVGRYLERQGLVERDTGNVYQ